MPKIDEKINALRGDRVKRVLKEEKKSQKWLAEKLFLKPEHLNMMLNGKRPLGEDKIQTIASLFPNRAMRIGWLLGYEDYENNADHLAKVVDEMNREGDLLFTGLSAFALLSGYEIIPPKIFEKKSLDEMFQEMRNGYVIKSGKSSISLSLEDMNRFENEVNDFVELMLKHLFARKEGKNG